MRAPGQGGRMQVLVVHAHPRADSFTAALCAAVRAARGGDVIDLCAEAFDPRLSADEHRTYADGAVPPDLAAHLEKLRAADALVFTAPVWWGGPPAVLRGWAERLLRPGLAFEVAPHGRLRPLLPNIRHLGLITATGAPGLYWRWLRRSPERNFLRAIAPCFHPKAARLHMALHGIDTTTPAQRAAFLAKVTARIKAL